MKRCQTELRLQRTARVGVCEWQTRKRLFFKMSSPSHELSKIQCYARSAENIWTSLFEQASESRRDKCHAHSSLVKANAVSLHFSSYQTLITAQKKNNLWQYHSVLIHISHTIHSPAYYLDLLWGSMPCIVYIYQIFIWCLFFNLNELFYYISK